MIFLIAEKQVSHAALVCLGIFNGALKHLQKLRVFIVKVTGIWNDNLAEDRACASSPTNQRRGRDGRLFLACWRVPEIP